MKKLLALVLALLILTGCAGQTDMESSDQTSASETQKPGLYTAGSAVEQHTNGAVRRFDLPEGNYSCLAGIGDKLLLAQTGEQTRMTVLAGKDLQPVISAQIPVDLSAQESRWQATHSGFVYYAEGEKQAVFLDPQLQELNRVEMPEDMQGKPVFSNDGGEIFYCTQGEIRALEVERQISRLLKSHNCNAQELLGSYFDGGILGCRIENTDGNVNIVYLSAENGQTLAADGAITDLYSYGNTYLVLRTDGVVRQRIIGTLETAPSLVNTDAEMVGALELGGVLGYHGSESGLMLEFYELASGMKTAAVSLEGFELPQAVLADRWTNSIWLLTADLETGRQVLLCWDVRASLTNDQTVCTGTVYTEEAPDETGLKACQDRVDALNKKHGIAIRIWKEAVMTTDGHALVPEYQVTAISNTLDILEQVLDLFPDNFLYKSASDKVRFCIVRSIDGGMGSANFWYSGNPFIVVSVGTDIRTDLLRGLGYMIDRRVLRNSYAFDDWDDLNPQGFVYGDAQTYSETYLQGENTAFLSEAAMNSAAEDRSTIFLYAMQSGNAEMFQSENMQRKLLALCEGIRETWNLQWKSQIYTWEQYLTEPIAP